MNIPDTRYLKFLLKDARKKQKNFSFSAPEETDAEIRYITAKPNVCFPGLLGGLYFRYLMESSGTEEKARISNNAKNYYRIVRKSGRILRVDSYLHGTCDGILLMHYEENKRYAFPFLPTGEASQNYIQVQSHNGAGEMMEDYMVRANQLVYHAYHPCPDGSVQHCQVFFARKGLTSSLYAQEGLYTFGQQVTYTETQVSN